MKKLKISIIGAAGQAAQNMNIMPGFPEAEGFNF